MEERGDEREGEEEIEKGEREDKFQVGGVKGRDV